MWIMQGRKEKIPDETPPNLKALIERCRDASEKRPTAEDAVTILEAEGPAEASPPSPPVVVPPRASVEPVSWATPAPPRISATKVTLLPSIPSKTASAKTSLKPAPSEEDKTASSLSSKGKYTGDLLTLLFNLHSKQEVQKDGALYQLIETKIEELASLPEETPLDIENQRFLNLAKRVMPEGGSYNPSGANMLVKQKREGQEKIPIRKKRRQERKIRKIIERCYLSSTGSRISSCGAQGSCQTDPSSDCLREREMGRTYRRCGP